MQPHQYPFPPEECIRRGKEIYERVVKPKLKPEDDRKFYSVDIFSEDYELDHDSSAAASRSVSRTSITSRCFRYP